MALHNVDFFVEWSGQVRENVKNGTVDRLLVEKLPKGAFKDLIAQLPDLFS